MKKRLQAIVEWVEPGSRIIDIGSDHLIIPNALIDQGITSLVFASDVNAGPLEAMKLNRQGRDITLIQSDGMLQVSEELDGAIIAGMGGRLIEKIIQESLPKFLRMNYLIVQPMQHIEEVRDFLQGHFHVIAERLISEDRKIYHLMKLVPGKDSYDSFLTKGLSPESELQEYYMQQLDYWTKLKPQVPEDKKPEVEQRITRLKQTNLV